MEDFVPFELAKKLKGKSFPQSPDYFNYSSYYDWDGLRKIHSLSNASVWFDPNISRDNIYFAPTISQVLKWLRKEGVNIYCTPNWRNKTDKYYAVCIVKGRLYNYDGYFNTYEQAALACIEYVLDNLI